jgi:Fe2+ or Zn2+ uptake regulation protein
MIDKYDGLYFLVCDICGEAVEKGFNDFNDAVDYKKENGWKSQKYKGEWEDVCPECQEG